MTDHVHSTGSSARPAHPYAENAALWVCTDPASAACAADKASAVDVAAGADVAAGTGAGADVDAVAGVDADVVGGLVGAAADKAGTGAGSLGVARQMIFVPLQRGCLPCRWKFW